MDNLNLELENVRLKLQILNMQAGPLIEREKELLMLLGENNANTNEAT